jgi:hypothetical protein
MLCTGNNFFQANSGRYESHYNIRNLSWFYTINAKIYLHNYIFFKDVFPSNRTVIPTYPNMVQPKILLAGAFEAQIWAPHRPWVSVGCGPVVFLGLRDVAGHDPTLKMRLRFWQVLIIVWLWLVHHCSMILWFLQYVRWAWVHLWFSGWSDDRLTAYFQFQSEALILLWPYINDAQNSNKPVWSIPVVPRLKGLSQ